MTEPFLGEVRMVSFGFAPRGYAACNGQLLPLIQNQALFALLGTSFGGNGQTTFGLPDLRGRVPVHFGSGAGLTPRAIGASFGSENVNLVETQMPAHAHSRQVCDVAATATTAASTLPARGAAPLYRSGAATTVSTGVPSQPSGGSQPHDNMMPYAVIGFVIALQGIFPSPN